MAASCKAEAAAMQVQAQLQGHGLARLSVRGETAKPRQAQAMPIVPALPPGI